MPSASSQTSLTVEGARGLVQVKIPSLYADFRIRVLGSTLDELAGLRLIPDAFHGDWNYSIQPRPSLK